MGKPASYGYEQIDAQTFAEWGVDFLKYDFCYKPAGVDGPYLFHRMGQELRASGRPILYSVCEWGANDPWKWAASAGAHMWRTTGDIQDSWESVEKLGFSQAGLEAYAGPDHWNDPDMLVVGMYGSGNVAHGGCTDEEYRSHFSLWCLLASPLMLGCDVRKMDATTKSILLNRRVIAINQDPLGRQGFLIEREPERFEVWMKPLVDGSVAVALFNRDHNTRKMSAAWESLRFHDRTVCRLEDLWSGEDLGQHDRAYAVTVPPHGVKLLRLTPISK